MEEKRSSGVNAESEKWPSSWPRPFCSLLSLEELRKATTSREIFHSFLDEGKSLNELASSISFRFYTNRMELEY